MPIHARVQHENNVFTIETDIDARISYEITDPGGLDVTKTANFAAWALLPIGMALGQDIVIDNAGDKTTERNAKALSEIWAYWLPHKLNPITVSFKSNQDVPRANTDEELFFYSGGIDSTYDLMKNLEEGGKHKLLTIDFMAAGPDQFDQLISKTRALASSASDTRLIVKTDIYRAYKRYGIRPGLGHGFALASVGFLWDGILPGAYISGGCASHQEFLWHPWGTNSIANEYFKSSSYSFSPSRMSLTRTQKVHELTKSPDKLDSLAFCINRKTQPRNCGTCSKCARTKAMFLVTEGHIPDIFIDNSWDADSFNIMELHSKKETLFLLEVYMEARKRNRAIPGLENSYRKLVLTPALRAEQSASNSSLKNRLRKLLGLPIRK